MRTSNFGIGNGIISITVAGKRRLERDNMWLYKQLARMQGGYDLNQSFREVFMSEGTGPLTPEQHDEFLDHFLRGMTCFEAEEHIAYHERLVSVGIAGDPAYARSQRELSATRRYLHLAERFRDYGVAETITLTEPFGDTP